MQNINHTSNASLGFERSSYAVIMVRSQSARISKGLVFRKAKALLTNFRLAGQFNRTLSNSGFCTSIDAALPATLAIQSVGMPERKLHAPELARSPAKDIQTWGDTRNTRNATTASRATDITANRLTLIISKERWGGGFVHPIANKQNSLVKVSVTTVCGN